MGVVVRCFLCSTPMKAKRVHGHYGGSYIILRCPKCGYKRFR